MAAEALDALKPAPGGWYADGTIGGGGHAERILDASSPTGWLFGCDRDGAAVEAAQQRLASKFSGRFEIRRANFSEMGEWIPAASCEGMILDLAPANWDAAAYPDPDKLDLTRDAGQQLGFGYGRHQCVGQQLARAELQIVFHTLLQRIPTLRLAVPLDEVPFKHDRLAYGVYELPVSW